MQSNDNSVNQHARFYFLDQGKSIAKLYQILDSNILAYHLRKWSGLFVEVMLYLLFLITIAFIFLFPVVLEFQLSERPAASIELKIDEIAKIVLIIRIVLVFLSLPLLFFAILLGRNRRRSNLIRQAFTEVKKMKEGFDQAVKDLQL